MAYYNFKNDIVHDDFISFRKKVAARRTLAEALRKKELEKPIHCESCGKKRIVQGHHRDYGQPLKVIWLCKHCHIEAHKSDHPMHPKNNDQTPNPELMNKKSVSISVTLGNKDYYRLQQLAFQKKTSLSNLIRSLIREKDLDEAQLRFNFDLDEPKKADKIILQKYYQMELFS